MSNRYMDPGWRRIGAWDDAKRRSLWVRFDEDHTVMELCSGREGDDCYCKVQLGDPMFDDLLNVVESQWWAQGDMTTHECLSCGRVTEDGRDICKECVQREE